MRETARSNDLDGEGPAGGAFWSRGQCLLDDRRGLAVLLGERERDRSRDGRINGQGVTGLNRDAAIGWAESRQAEARKGVLGDAFDRMLKRGRRRFAIALAKAQRPDRVPRIRAALAAIEMPALFECQLALEGLERRLLFVTCEVNEASQPVEGDGAEP